MRHPDDLGVGGERPGVHGAAPDHHGLARVRWNIIINIIIIIVNITMDSPVQCSLLNEPVKVLGENQTGRIKGLLEVNESWVER